MKSYTAASKVINVCGTHANSSIMIYFLSAENIGSYASMPLRRPSDYKRMQNWVTSFSKLSKIFIIFFTIHLRLNERDKGKQ